VLGYDRLDKTLRRTDYFMLACPLTDVNEELIDLAELTTLLSSAAVNVARRSVVIDTLVAGLQTEYIRGAGLDVTNPKPILGDHLLWQIKNCLVSPHIGGHTPTTGGRHPGERYRRAGWGWRRHAPNVVTLRPDRRDMYCIQLDRGRCDTVQPGTLDTGE
jgi:hypothetical protein